MLKSRYILFVYTFESNESDWIGADYFYIDGNLKSDDEIRSEALNRTREIAKVKNIKITDFRISDDDKQLFQKVK